MFENVNNNNHHDKSDENTKNVSNKNSSKNKKDNKNYQKLVMPLSIMMRKRGNANKHDDNYDVDNAENSVADNIDDTIQNVVMKS